ncbi:MAG: DUF1580 domain-containing protein [Planctomycetaceae bacterium]|nr:DUF1580 domain-containing protein [Planctomycetaceae bacterium]MCB9953575.1 DUF1580 domain-containing protein [Planctomycetaceae bacterium]
MPIDVNDETLITFTELARSLPHRRGDRPVHVATIHRWRSRGLNGIRLEAVKVGGAWHTSHEAFARFTGRLTAHAEGTDACVPPASKRQSHKDADQSLQDSGW